jgi:prepilin-type processing-associated H-X9-DG protein
VFFNQINDARFRHMRDTVCNVAFADGSVQSLHLKKNLTNVGSPDTEFLRKYLMIRWPSGATPGGYPGYIP